MKNKKGKPAPETPKRSHHKKKVEIHLPVPVMLMDIPQEVVIEPVLLEKPPPPLEKPTDTIRCVLTMRETFWQGTPYIVLTAAPGHELPPELRTGQESVKGAAMNMILLAQNWRAWSITDWLIAIIVIGGCAGIVYILFTQVFKIPIPSWVVGIFWIVIACIIGIGAIHIIQGL